MNITETSRLLILPLGYRLVSAPRAERWRGCSTDSNKKKARTSFPPQEGLPALSRDSRLYAVCTQARWC